MFTQCSRCDTVFRLSAETLRAAGGQVRCGRCGEVFNALARLAEDASAFPPGESALEMEARADEILHSPAPPSSPVAPAHDEDLSAADVDFARLQLIDKFKPSQPDANTPPRVDNGAPPRPGPLPPPPPRAPPPAPRAGPAAAAGKPAAKSAEAPAVPPQPVESPAEPESPEDGSLEFTLPPGELDRIFVDPKAARTQQLAAGAPAGQSRPARQPVDDGADVTGSRAAGFEVAEHVRRDMLAGMMQRRLDEPALPQDRAANLAWGAAAVVLALVLLAQLIHENRDWLATHAPLRGPLHTLYGAMGVRVQVASNLSAYQLRQWGVTGDPNAAGTLRVRASILNTAPQLQPYPLLRVTLANRFGTRIGTRDFEPAEYLGKPTVRMMAPGERADATLDILDPGKDAEGFEIDVCLRGADRKISCAADAAPQAGTPQAGAPQPGASRTKP